MKKTMLSLAAASLVFGASAYADVDVDLGGQAKVYYETNEADGAADSMKLFKKDASKIAIGLQLNAKADLGNGFGFGSQATFMDTWGLEKNLAEKMPQDEDGQTVSNMITLTKLYLTKKIGNTTVKGGRQEIAKAISPFAYSEKWNQFKNTIDTILIVNTDVPDTTLVGAYFSAGNSSLGNTAAGYLNEFNDIAGGLYMVTAATKAIPMTKLTGSVYHATHTPGDDDAADAFWVDAKIAGDDLPAGLNIGLQAGSIMPDATGSEDTTAFGVKAGVKIENFTVGAAYTSVDDGTAAIKNQATNVKTPLFTQQIFNQFYIGHDANTWQVSASAGFGDAGKLIVKYAAASMGDKALASNAPLGYADADASELDVIYKIKSGGVQYFAAYVMNDNDKDKTGKADNDKVRFWASYGF